MATRRSFFGALASMLVAPAVVQAQGLEQLIPQLLPQLLDQNNSSERRDDRRDDDHHNNGRGNAHGRNRRRCWWEDRRVSYRDQYGRWRYRTARREVCR